jgi:DNA polymerase-1
MSKKLVLVDGTALAYRNHFSMIKRPLITSKGENTSALYGTLNSLLKIRNKLKPDYLIVTFDSSKPTFRHEKYKEYKSTRAKMPEELARILPVINEAISALNIPVIVVDGVEADDVIGTLALRAEQDGIDVILYSSDKDFLQLIDSKISMLAPGGKSKEDKMWTIENAHEKFGVKPSQILDLLSLMGDSSDNIPGVAGIGVKTAVRLLQKFDSLDEIYSNLDLLSSNEQNKLINNKDLAYLSRDLAEIRTDIPIQIEWDEAKLGEPDHSRLIPILTEYELVTLIRKLLPKHTDTATGSEKYELIKSIGKLESIIDSLCRASKIVIDTETTSQNPMDASLVGISFTSEEREGYYAPLAHRDEGSLFEHPDNLPKKAAYEIIQKLLSSDSLKIGQNIKYDLKVLFRHGLELHGNIFDTMVAAYLIEPGTYKYNLDLLALKFLQYQMTSFIDLAGKGKKQKTFDTINLEKAAKYSCEDADITLRLANIFEDKLRKLELWELFDELEMPLIPVLTRMEMTGVRLDVDKLNKMAKELESEKNSIAKRIFEITEEQFNIDSPKQLSSILFEKMGLPAKKKTKTGYSTDSSVLHALASKGYEIGELLIKYRELAKLINTYISALPKLINKSTGRIHTTYNQTIAATGRLSSSDPNLQNIPVRGELGAQIRTCFVPQESWLMMSADYSQIELRLMAHLSKDENLISAFTKGSDVHAHTASLITELSMEDITPALRGIAKVVNFGIMYGMSPHGLTQQLHISYEEAKAFINSYFKRYPSVADYIVRIKNYAQEKGYVETIMGRRRYLPDLSSKSHQSREAAKRAAVSTPLQGSAADIIKKSMINIDKRLREKDFKARMLMQVHDELIFEMPEQETESLTKMVRTEMENVVELNVPLIVDIGIGHNWLEAHS